MKCPICNGRMKSMLKPDTQFHCRGECGLILRIQNEQYVDRLENMINALQDNQQPQSDR